MKIAQKRGKTPKELLKELYLEKQMTGMDIERELGITTVHRWLRRFGMTRIGKWQRKKDVPSFGWIVTKTNRKMIKLNGKEMFEHRFIMEQHLSRPLRKDEVVHHINGDTLDNRIENLQVMTKSEHHILHNTGKSRKGNRMPPMSEETKKKISETRKRIFAEKRKNNQVPAI